MNCLVKSNDLKSSLNLFLTGFDETVSVVKLGFFGGRGGGGLGREESCIVSQLTLCDFKFQKVVTRLSIRKHCGKRLMSFACMILFVHLLIFINLLVNLPS